VNLLNLLAGAVVNAIGATVLVGVIVICQHTHPADDLTRSDHVAGVNR
jgi:hypothetical protein